MNYINIIIMDIILAPKNIIIFPESNYIIIMKDVNKYRIYLG